MADKKLMEIDVWINHGCLSAFRNDLVSDNDVKHVDFDPIKRDEEGIRFSVSLIAYSELKFVHDGTFYQVKDVYETI